MLIDKLREITSEQIPSKNPSLKQYFALSTNEKNATTAFETNAIAGQLVAFQLNKQLKSNFSEDTFTSEVMEHFEKKMSEEEYALIVKDIYFPYQQVPVLTPLMYMAKPFSKDTKTKKSLEIFKQMMQKNEVELALKTDLNFIEQDIYNIFNKNIMTKTHDVSTNSYVSFLDDIFTKDFLFLLDNQHYFKVQIDRFLKFYLFIYSAQLALNINETHILEQPTSQKLYFILNHEKASSERKSLVNFGYRTLIDKARYMFPYLSLLENLSDAVNNKNLKFYHFKEIPDTVENIAVIDELTKLYRNAKSLPEETLFNSRSIPEAFQTLFNSTMEQFRTDKKAVLDRFITAFEKQISGSFFQSRGRSGKVLVLDQDTILLLTNLAIGHRDQLRFQDLMDEFRERSVYFDPKSEDALLELYERVGNVDRKSDSGDAVYVRSI